jgi:hypothetical protein
MLGFEIGCIVLVRRGSFSICATQIDSSIAALREICHRPFDSGRLGDADGDRQSVHVRRMNWEHGMNLTRKADF